MKCNRHSHTSHLVLSSSVTIQASMSSSSRFSYQKLRKLPTGVEEDGGRVLESPATTATGGGRRRGSWLRLRRRRRWRRSRVRIGRLLKRKAVVVRIALREVVKRLKEGRPYIGDLFAGNYMFVHAGRPGLPRWAHTPQEGPTSTGCHVIKAQSV